MCICDVLQWTENQFTSILPETLPLQLDLFDLHLTAIVAAPFHWNSLQQSLSDYSLCCSVFETNDMVPAIDTCRFAIWMNLGSKSGTRQGWPQNIMLWYLGLMLKISLYPCKWGLFSTWRLAHFWFLHQDTSATKASEFQTQWKGARTVIRNCRHSEWWGPRSVKCWKGPVCSWEALESD